MELEAWLESEEILKCWKRGFNSIKPPFSSQKVVAKRLEKNLWAEYREPYPEIRLIAFSLVPTLSVPRINCRVWFYAEQRALRERFLCLSAPTLLGQEVILYEEPLLRANWKSQLDAEGITVRGLQYDVECLDIFRLPIRGQEMEVYGQIEKSLIRLGEEFLSWVDCVYWNELTAETLTQHTELLEMQVHEPTVRPLFPDEVKFSESYLEGAVHQVLVNAYERDPKARQACINHYGLSCQACDMNFEVVYGELGTGFIHVHHEIPLHSLGEGYAIDPVHDMKPLCPNCHAMVHRTDPPMKVTDLRRVILSQAPLRGRSD